MNYRLKWILFGLANFLFIIVLFGIIAHFWRQEIFQWSAYIADTIGIAPLLAAVFFSDAFFSPIPPDILLWIIGHSKFGEDAVFYVFLFSLSSFLGGCLGWKIGRQIGSSNNFLDAPQSEDTQNPKKIGKGFGGDFSQSKYIPLAKKYGTWIVGLGAMTPIPFSVCCWSAGFVGMTFKDFLKGALWRFPRMYLYFYALQLAGEKWITSYLN